MQFWETPQATTEDMRVSDEARGLLDVRLVRPPFPSHLTREIRGEGYGTHRGVDGRQGSARMLIFVTAMFLLPLVLVALYLYVHGVFTK